MHARGQLYLKSPAEEISLDTDNMAKIAKVMADLTLKLAKSILLKNRVLVAHYFDLIQIVAEYHSILIVANKELNHLDRADINTQKTTPVGVAFEDCLKDIRTRNAHKLFAPTLRAIEQGNFDLKHVDAPAVNSRRPS